ncbi:MAG: DUF924 family protein [Sphingomonadales bacterium]
MNKEADMVLHFWFEECEPVKWWKKDPDFDYEIKERFKYLMSKAEKGKLDNWADAPKTALALILLLDQFPRNAFRDTPQAFATDKKARSLTRIMLRRGHLEELSLNECIFSIMPLEHSENKVDQELCVELIGALGSENYLNYALAHKKVIDRFGRFPHRNAILGRANTPEEEEYLNQPGSGF